MHLGKIKEIISQELKEDFSPGCGVTAEYKKRTHQASSKLALLSPLDHSLSLSPQEPLMSLHGVMPSSPQTGTFLRGSLCALNSEQHSFIY